MSERITLERTVCICESTTSNYSFVTETRGEYHDDNSYVRASEYLEVTFQPRVSEEVTLAKVQAIDETIETLFSKIEEFRQKKQELLSITFQESSDAN